MKCVPFDFVFHKYSQNIKKGSLIFLQNKSRITRQIFLLFKKGKDLLGQVERKANVRN